MPQDLHSSLQFWRGNSHSVWHVGIVATQQWTVLLAPPTSPLDFLLGFDQVIKGTEQKASGTDPGAGTDPGTGTDPGADRRRDMNRFYLF